MWRWSVCCQGGTVLWLVGLNEDVRDSIRKDSLVIIQVVVGYGFCMDVESFNSVNPVPLLFKSYCKGRKIVFFQRAFKFTYYNRNRSPLQEKKIITIKLKKTE